jgi:hypothetical protein
MSTGTRPQADLAVPAADLAVPRAPATLSAAGDPVGWLTAHAGAVRALLREHGAVLVTGLGVCTAGQLAAVRDLVAPGQAECAEQHAPRQALGDGVHTFPEWAADREMCLHHEQGQATRFPGVLAVACVQAADTGGAVLLGDTRAVLRELPPDLVERFRARGWSLVRNFRPHFGLPWSTVFGTADPAAVEAACAARRIQCVWHRDGTLRTVQRRSAVIPHPITGQLCWFNQVAFFSQWSLPAADREVLLDTFGPDALPFNTGYGDGGPVSEEEFDEILAAYARVTVSVRPAAGDVLVIDNLRTAHGRQPYTGTWRVLVALAAPVRRPHWSPPAGPPGTEDKGATA